MEARLHELFSDYECHEGDVVFRHTQEQLVCWDGNKSRQLGIRLPRPANVTHQTPIDYAMPLYGYVMPLLLAVTIVANTLIVVVMSRRHMRTPTNLLLMAMAVSDMLTLLLPAPWMLYMYTFGNYNKPLDSIASCYMYVTMTDTLPSMFHTSSIWLTLTLAVQRYIYVCHAAAARFWCTESRVVRAIVWIYVLSLMHQASRFFDRSFDVLEVIYLGVVTPSCSIGRPLWVTDGINENLYFSAYFGFRLVFIHVLPCVSLVVFNILLFRTLQEAQVKRNRLFKDSSREKRECKKMTDSYCTTLMLIVVVSVFLIVEIPLAVVTCLHIIQNLTEHVQSFDYKVIQALVVVVNFTISLSYPINFAIYCGMSRQFRETFQDIFINGNMLQYPSSGSGRHSTVMALKTETVL